MRRASVTACPRPPFIRSAPFATVPDSGRLVRTLGGFVMFGAEDGSAGGDASGSWLTLSPSGSR